VTDLDRGSSDQKTFGDTGENFVVWSRDGLRLAFLKIERGIYALNIAGGGTELLSPIKGVPTSLSERHLLYTFPIRPRDPDAKLYMLEIGGLGEAIPVGSPNGNSYSGEFSPDGSYIAFGSRKSRQAEVYVRPTPPRTGETIPVSINGGELPRWRGREIFFVSPEGGLMAADITLGDKVSVGIPHLLFRFDFDFDWEDGYDVFKDGQRFLILSPSEEVDSPITVIQNWWVRLK
jgi:hypothetical protein